MRQELKFKIYGEQDDVLDALSQLSKIYRFTTSAIRDNDSGGVFVFVDILEARE